MKNLLLTLSLCLSIACGHTQILNPEINVEVRIAEFYGNSDNDATTTDEQSMLITSILNDGTNSLNLSGCSIFDCDAPCTVNEDTDVGPFYFGWIRGWEEDVVIDFQLHAWGDEGGSECVFDTGDQDEFSGLASNFNLTNPVLTNNRNPIQWHADLGINDGWLFDNSTFFNIKPQIIWAYRFGDSCSDPLDFGNIANGETKTHTNSNRSTPGVLMGEAAIGYTNQNGDFHASAEAYYSFSLAEASMVTISTDNPGTSYDTFLGLQAANCEEVITTNDDVSDFNLTSRIEIELEAGNYTVFVEGFEMEQGNFELSITANTIVGTQDLNAALPITIGPNPTDGLLNISIDDSSLLHDVVVEVYSLQGQLLQKNGLPTSSTTLDLGTYSVGTYLVRIITPDGQLTKKVLVY